MTWLETWLETQRNHHERLWGQEAPRRRARRRPLLVHAGAARGSTPRCSRGQLRTPLSDEERDQYRKDFAECWKNVDVTFTQEELDAVVGAIVCKPTLSGNEEVPLKHNTFMYTTYCYVRSTVPTTKCWYTRPTIVTVRAIPPPSFAATSPSLRFTRGSSLERRTSPSRCRPKCAR